MAADVSTTILRLVRKFGKLQPAVLWEHVMNILDILDALIQVKLLARFSMVSNICRPSTWQKVAGLNRV